MEDDFDIKAHLSEYNIPLKLVGITYNQIESGVYALILREINGLRRLPIIIGYPEAQAIECRLQNVRTPRPLTHDLMAAILGTLDAEVVNVTIRRFPNGVFGAYVNIRSKSDTLISLDARSSDAIALAIRVNAPILTSESVLASSGIQTDTSTKPEVRSVEIGLGGKSDTKQDSEAKIETAKDIQSKSAQDPDTRRVERLSNMALNVLEKKLEKAIEEDNFEYAALIKRAIDISKSR